MQKRSLLTCLVLCNYSYFFNCHIQVASCTVVLRLLTITLLQYNYSFKLVDHPLLKMLDEHLSERE